MPGCSTNQLGPQAQQWSLHVLLFFFSCNSKTFCRWHEKVPNAHKHTHTHTHTHTHIHTHTHFSTPDTGKQQLFTNTISKGPDPSSSNDIWMPNAQMTSWCGNGQLWRHHEASSWCHFGIQLVLFWSDRSHSIANKTAYNTVYML